MPGNSINRISAKALSTDLPEAAWFEAERITESFAPLLSDESKLTGHAARLSFPTTEQELVAILKTAQQAKMPITLSGARTGITGGAVPDGGWLVSFNKMNRCLDLKPAKDGRGFILTCQPGLTLEELNKALETRNFPGSENWPRAGLETLEKLRSSPTHFFPPDPTERSASIGGMIACNASGARTLRYGATRKYIERLRVVLASGHTVDITRGSIFAAADGAFELATPFGEIHAAKIQNHRAPNVKNAAGFFMESGMDMLDLFIGAEGALGIVTQADLRLLQAPQAILAVIAFFPTEQDAINFVEAARRGLNAANIPEDEQHPLALEYFDPRSLALLREQKIKIGPSSPIPDIPPDPCAAVYVELATTESSSDSAAEALLELLAEFNSDPDTAWCATTNAENEKLKAFRHALPESINQRIGERAARFPGLTKLGTDFAVPDAALRDIMAAYHSVLIPAGLEYLIFGHIGNNHVHVNILPRNMDEYALGKKLYIELAARALALGGTVSAEHGIGKLKKNMLFLMYGEDGINRMRQIKRLFDPLNMLNPKNLFD